LSKRSALSISYTYTPYTSRADKKVWGRLLAFYTATKKNRKQNSSIVEKTKLSAGVGHQRMTKTFNQHSSNDLNIFLFAAKLSKSYVFENGKVIGLQAVYLQPITHKYTKNTTDYTHKLHVYPGIEFNGLFTYPLKGGTVCTGPFFKCIIGEEINRCLGVKVEYLMQY